MLSRVCTRARTHTDNAIKEEKARQAQLNTDLHVNQYVFMRMLHEIVQTEPEFLQNMALVLENHGLVFGVPLWNTVSACQ